MRYSLTFEVNLTPFKSKFCVDFVKELTLLTFVFCKIRKRFHIVVGFRGKQMKVMVILKLKISAFDLKSQHSLKLI